MNSQNLKKVLVVDDIPENIDIIVGILKDDYEIIAARSGKAVLKLIQSMNIPDIIRLDIMMPEMDDNEKAL